MNTTAHMLSQQIQAQADQFDAIYESADPFEELFEAPLEITVSQQLTVILCTGGPHVEAVATIEDGAICDVRIEGYWAGETQTRPVQEGSALMRALETYAEAITVPA